MNGMTITRNTPLAQPLNLPEPQAGGETAAQTLPNPTQARARAGQIFPQGATAQDLRGGPLEAAQALPNQATALPPNVTRVSLGARGVEALLPLDGVRRPDAAGWVQGQVRRGEEVYRLIMNALQPGEDGELMPLPESNKENVVALTWYLQALGSARAAVSSGNPDRLAMFKEGAFMLEDPHGCLETYLRNANSYVRKSSHLKDFQAVGETSARRNMMVQDGDPRHPFWRELYKPRGVDVRGAETPHGRRTILFQSLPVQDPHGSQASIGTGRRMLFVKMEPHGCRGFSVKGGMNEDEVVGFFKKLGRFFANIADTIGHGLGFLESVSQRRGVAAVNGQNNRERIPSDIQRDYRQILSAAAREPATLETLSQGNPLSDSSGIRQMCANLQALPRPLTQAVDALLEKLNRYDQAELRIGGEIILLRSDPLLQAAPQAAQAAPQVE
ncbi:MAG: hypothetical protein LBU53_13280 [Zoogloeaceae bacterium]|jgi:hypothetical protein|nr:hypothetical protein [Zoogloeaceae bacterium]